MIFPNMLLMYFLFFCLYLRNSTEDLHSLALQQGLSYEEADELLEYEKHGRFKRQATFKSGAGIPQNKICGINGKSSSRSRRHEGFSGNASQGSQDWPWMALLTIGKEQVPFCGGVLLNSRYVLTASHCFESLKEKSVLDTLLVRLGENDITQKNETTIQVFSVDKKIGHPRFDITIYIHDITLLKLNDTVNYTRYVRPICLPNAEPRVDEITTVAGWGKIGEKKPQSEVLLYVDVPVWDHDQCEKAVFGINELHSGNICASEHRGKKDSCNGDSGGPLMYQENGKRWVNVGIVSWGKVCGRTYPGIYTSVFKYLSWIAKHILDASP